jgi:hypothetical protein
MSLMICHSELIGLYFEAPPSWLQRSISMNRQPPLSLGDAGGGPLGRCRRGDRVWGWSGRSDGRAAGGFEYVHPFLFAMPASEHPAVGQSRYRPSRNSLL